MYLKHQALIPTVMELDQRGWTTKQWVCKAGATKGGRPFDKNALFKLLTNVVYIGKVRYHEEIHLGEHTAIVDEQIWQRVQAVLQRNRRTGGALVKNKYGALLKGLLRCAPCKCAMVHAYTSQGTKRYRYYVCLHAQKRGWHNCPTKSVPAGEIEAFVVEQIKQMGRDPRVLAEIVRQARGRDERTLADLQREEQALKRDLARHVANLRKLSSEAGGSQRAGQLANLQDGIRLAEQRATEVRDQIVALSREMVDQREVETAMTAFSPVWDTLNPREQARIVHLLVERVDYDGARGTISVTFRANGIKTLAAQQPKEIAA
jgi:site-specific DNA recombinase